MQTPLIEKEDLTLIPLNDFEYFYSVIEKSPFNRMDKKGFLELKPFILHAWIVDKDPVAVISITKYLKYHAFDGYEVKKGFVNKKLLAAYSVLDWFLREYQEDIYTFPDKENIPCIKFCQKLGFEFVKDMDLSGKTQKLLRLQCLLYPPQLRP